MSHSTSFARFSMGGRMPLADTEILPDVQEILGLTDDIPFGYLYDQTGMVSSPLFSKEHAMIVLLYVMKAEERVTEDDVVRVTQEILLCDELVATFARFVMSSKCDDLGRTYGMLVFFSGICISEMKSKNSAREVVRGAVEKNFITSMSLDEILAQINQSDLPQTLTSVEIIDGQIMLVDSNGKALLTVYSQEFGLSVIANLRDNKHIDDEEESHLERQIEALSRTGDLKRTSSRMIEGYSKEQKKPFVHAYSSNETDEPFEVRSRNSLVICIRKMMLDRLISESQGNKFLGGVPYTRLPNSCADIQMCGEDAHAHLFDENGEELSGTLHSRRQAKDQLYEELSHGRIVPSSAFMIEEKLMKLPLPEKHETDEDYVKTRAHNAHLFPDCLQ